MSLGHRQPEIGQGFYDPFGGWRPSTGLRAATDPRTQDKTIVGGKGANLAEMAGIGLPVPPGFTITTEECVRYLRGRRGLLGRPAGRSRRRRSPISRHAVGKKLRRCRRSAAGLGPLGRAGVDAGHDGYRAQPRAQRCDRRRPRRDLRRRALRVGQLSPLHPDVFRRRARARSRAVRGSAGDRQGRQRLLRRHRACRPPTGRRWSPNTRRSSRPSWGKPFPQDVHEQLWGAIRAVFGSWQSGPRQGLSPPATTFPATGAPRSTSRRWCSAIWATPAPPASPSPAIRRPASGPITANGWSTRRARMSSPASAPRNT